MNRSLAMIISFIVKQTPKIVINFSSVSRPFALEPVKSKWKQTVKNHEKVSVY